ncbi:MAG: N-acetylmuramidase family protein [Cellvibrionaceae bacterium]
MAKKILNSVGKGGKNDLKDVAVIRHLLSWHKLWVHPHIIKASGPNDKALESTIELFQKNACSLSKPDGRVDPNGFTLSRLNMTHIPKPKHSIFKASYKLHSSGLKQSDYDNAAKALNCEPEAIQAVAEVETIGDSWDSMGRPRILYEKHYFRRLTTPRDKYNKTHPDISGPYQHGTHGLYRAQYPKLYRAAVLDEKAALQSASWGRFQIMGRNYKEAGFSSVSAFVDSIMINEAKQLDAFVNFIKSDRSLLKAIQNKNWADFARSYNGRDYAKNNYDKKMDAAYKKFISISKSSASSLKGKKPSTTP